MNNYKNIKEINKNNDYNKIIFNVYLKHIKYEYDILRVLNDKKNINKIYKKYIDDIDDIYKLIFYYDIIPSKKDDIILNIIKNKISIINNIYNNNYIKDKNI